MGIFANTATDDDIKFLRDNIHIINNWTELRCKEILVDSKSDFYVKSKSYVLSNYIYGKRNIAFLLMTETNCFGFFTSSGLQVYTPSKTIIKRGTEFFSFLISRDDNISPKISELLPGRTEVVSINSPDDQTVIFNIIDGMTLYSSMDAVFTPTFHQIYGCTNLDTHNKIHVSRLFILRFE
ncbi:hypothetical protein EIN_176600 [Entamoeba invadens IP1]|uniref:hypothetical protein n=1 Tax=Entamoeba invadens IP1 TaxID=370355 RepID=UPI0002C3F7E3|nr:hypothetical protein EIN_176600 [Entamoeba invadens IP1]ELP93833.1 hypothetical protein EIN_176600 [Entamoeba invadens IP1]|eukprot:XP_004260604.1 hypothetical protein EIN_176600 [Entamoeba invadens IP1]